MSMHEEVRDRSERIAKRWILTEMGHTLTERRAGCLRKLVAAGLRWRQQLFPKAFRIREKEPLLLHQLIDLRVHFRRVGLRRTIQALQARPIKRNLVSDIAAGGLSEGMRVVSGDGYVHVRAAH